MKIKEGYVLRSIEDEHIVVPTGEEAVNFNGIVTLNDTGKLLFEQLRKGSDEDTLVKLLEDTYDVDEATARKDVRDFLQVLKDRDMIVE